MNNERAHEYIDFITNPYLWPRPIADDFDAMLGAVEIADDMEVKDILAYQSQPKGTKAVATAEADTLICKFCFKPVNVCYYDWHVRNQHKDRR